MYSFYSAYVLQTSCLYFIMTTVIMTDQNPTQLFASSPAVPRVHSVLTVFNRHDFCSDLRPSLPRDFLYAVAFRPLSPPFSNILWRNHKVFPPSSLAHNSRCHLPVSSRFRLLRRHSLASITPPPLPHTTAQRVHCLAIDTLFPNDVYSFRSISSGPRRQSPYGPSIRPSMRI